MTVILPYIHCLYQTQCDSDGEMPSPVFLKSGINPCLTRPLHLDWGVAGGDGSSRLAVASPARAPGWFPERGGGWDNNRSRSRPPVSAMVMVLWLDPFYALMCVFIAHIIRVCGWVAPTCYLSVHPRGLMPESSRVTGGRRALIGNGG